MRLAINNVSANAVNAHLVVGIWQNECMFVLPWDVYVCCALSSFGARSRDEGNDPRGNTSHCLRYVFKNNMHSMLDGK